MSGKQEFLVLSFRALITRGSRCTSYVSPLGALLPQPSAPACRFWEPSPASSRWCCPQITLTGDHPQQHRHSVRGFLPSSGVCRAPLHAFDKFNPAPQSPNTEGLYLDTTLITLTPCLFRSVPDRLLELRSKVLKKFSRQTVKGQRACPTGRIQLCLWAGSRFYPSFTDWWRQWPWWADSLQIYCVIMNMQPVENPHSLYFNQFTAPLYMHQLFWQTNAVLVMKEGEEWWTCAPHSHASCCFIHLFSNDPVSASCPTCLG